MDYDNVSLQTAVYSKRSIIRRSRWNITMCLYRLPPNLHDEDEAENVGLLHCALQTAPCFTYEVKAELLDHAFVSLKNSP